MTRRKFVAGGAALAAVVFLPACGGSAAPKTRSAYRLTTGCGDGSCSCNACAKHAANKLFPSKDAADAHRAHRYCNCDVEETSLPRAQWEQLFGKPDDVQREVVDRRAAWVQEVIGRS